MDRYESGGRALLFLMPSELALAPLLQQRKVPLQKIALNTAKFEPVMQQLQGLMAQDPELKHLGQKV